MVYLIMRELGMADWLNTTASRSNPRGFL
jgi:hypothetical protein